MSGTRVSIALASCEGERFVDAQLASIAAQTRLPDELVVCDDASSDETLARVRRFAEQAPFPVRVTANPTRLGTTRNFEQAVRACTGDVVFLADQDDVWLPEKIAALVAALEASPSAGAALCNGAVVDADGRTLGYDLWAALDFSLAEQARVRAGRAHEVFARHVVAAGTTFAFRRRFAPLLFPFPDLRSAHDAWIAFLVAAVADVALVDRSLIQYRLHDRNQLGLRRMGLFAQYAAAKQQLAQGAFDYAACFFEEAGERLRSPAAAELPLRPGVLEVVDEKALHSRIRDAMPPTLVEDLVIVGSQIADTPAKTRPPGAILAFHADTGKLVWSFYAMPPTLVGRLPIVIAEARQGRYRRYAYGWKSVAQDLFLR